MILSNILILISILVFAVEIITFQPAAAVVIYSCPSSLLLRNETADGINGSKSEITVPHKFSSTGHPLNFTLESGSLECPDGIIQVILNASNTELSGCHFTPSGMLEGPILGAGHNYVDQYCVESFDDESIILSACQVNCTNPNTPCIEKCCGPEQGFHLNSNDVCQNLTPETPRWKPVFHDFVNETHPPVALAGDAQKQIRPHFIKNSECPAPTSYYEIATINTDGHVNSDGNIHLRVLQNGSIFVQSATATESKWQEYPAHFGTVCLDVLPGDDRKFHLIGLICHEEIYEDMEDYNTTRGTINFVHAILMILCSLFLLGTIAIYCLLWEKQNIHGWTVMSYVISLFFMYILLATDKLVTVNGLLDSGEFYSACWTNGLLAHFAFLSTFSWLTIINFDIWSKFRAMNPNPMKSLEIRRFIYYAIFAFGAPFLVIVIGLSLGAIFSTTGSVVTPNYGTEHSCFLRNSAQGYYIFYPVGVLMALNFMFFSSTAIIIFRHYKATENIHDKKSRQQRESFKMILKLCVVMGFTWVFELLSFIFDDENQPDHGVVWIIVFSILDCVNILQALGIFLIFVWKRQILTQLWQKYPALRPFLAYLKGLPGCRRSLSDFHHSSSKMTTKSGSKSLHRSQSRKPSLGNTSFETVDL